MNAAIPSDEDRALWKRHFCVGGHRHTVGKYLPHTGRRQQLRELRRSWKAFEKECKASAELDEARDTLLQAVVDIVAPEQEEQACWFAVLASRVRSSATGKRFADGLNSAIDELISAPRVDKSWTDAARP